MSSSSDLEFDVHPGHITFWQGAQAHRRAALRRFTQVTLVLFVAFGAIFAVDYVVQFAGGGLAYNVVFFSSLMMMSVLLGFALGLSRYARTERWTLDRIQQELRVERFTFGRSGRMEAIELTHLRALQRQGHALEAVLDDMQRIRLVEARSKAHLDALYTALHTFVSTHSLKLGLDDELATT